MGVNLRMVSTKFYPASAYTILEELANVVGIESIRATLNEIEAEQIKLPRNYCPCHLPQVHGHLEEDCPYFVKE